MSAVPTGHYALSQIIGPVDPRPRDRVRPAPYDGARDTRRVLSGCDRFVQRISRKGGLMFEGFPSRAFPASHFELVARPE